MTEKIDKRKFNGGHSTKFKGNGRGRPSNFKQVEKKDITLIPCPLYLTEEGTRVLIELHESKLMKVLNGD